MNIIIGQAASGDRFYRRNDLIELFWKKIRQGSNILISAPRRIGKTSLMLYFKDYPETNYQVSYLITESVNNQNEFFKKLVKELYTRLSTLNKFSSTLSQIASSTVIKSIGKEGISFEKKDIDYQAEFVNMVHLLNLEDEQILLMIDEYAQTVENILQDEGKQAAIKFLEANREIRIDPEIKKKIQFVYAGSIGLENIVSQLNAVSTINDLYYFRIGTFSKEEAKVYIREVPLKGEILQFDENIIDYLLDKIQWFTPFYINVLLDEMENILVQKNSSVAAIIDVDLAFNNALQNRTYFEHWHTRLRKAYSKESYNFAKELLNIISVNGSIDKAEIINLAHEHNIADGYKDILNALVYDGYINNIDTKDKYIFNSPLLGIWWRNNVAD